MKKMIRVILSMVFIMGFSFITFAGIEKSGDYYRFIENDEYVYSGFVQDDTGKYYIGDNGYVAVNTWVVVADDERYYASSNGKLYVNTVETIDGKGYAFDSEGKVRYGWVDGLYYANDNGYLVTGFQQLPIMTDDWLDEKKTVDEDLTGAKRWFYFAPSGTKKYQKFYSENANYEVKTVDEKKYCFDGHGVMRTGWRPVKDKTPVMAGYMYFSEEENEKFAYGQAITASWYSCEPISTDGDRIGTGEIRYFYFLPTGEPICAKEGTYVKHKINTKTYCFNDKGYAVYGIKNVNGDYYYFGDSVNDCSMRTGKTSVNTGGGYKLDYYFETDGRGFTGVYKDKLYYKGLLQKAAEGSGCEAVNINGTVRLINTSGTVLKNRKKHKDSDGVAWSTNSVGVVTYGDDGINGREPDMPEESGDN